MGDNCVRYLHCVEYNSETGKLRVRTCTDKELIKAVKRRRFIVVTDNHTKEAIIRFMENELLRRGKVSDASLLSVMTGEYTARIARVYYNSSVIVVAVETFATADCLLGG